MILTKYKEYVTKYNLKRFVNAHRNVYASALKEIQAGKKQSQPSNHLVKRLKVSLSSFRTADLLFRFLHLPERADVNRKVYRPRQAD